MDLRLLAIVLAACKAKEVEPRPIDAGRPIDAAIDAAPPADARAKAAAKPVKLAAGDATCALMDDHTVRCWGANDRGQLGNGTRAASQLPIALELHAVKDLQLAGGTGCALLDDGSVTCWGAIAWHGKPEDTLKPAGVLGVTGVTQLFVLPGLGCGRVAHDAMVCWGAVDAAGHPASAPAHRQPTPAVGMEHVKVLAAAAALRDDGTLFTWGGKPVTLAGVSELGAREHAVCGRLGDGSVQCPVPRCATEVAAPPPPPPPAKPKKPAKKPAKGKPVKPAPPPAPPPPKPETLAFPPAKQLAFELGWCVVTDDGKLECSESCGKPGKPQLDRVDRVEGHCAVQTTGAVRCDGKPIANLSAPSMIAGSCALVKEGVLCWGVEGKAEPVAL